MNKNTVFMKHIKRFLAIGLALVVTITLSGCSSSDSFPLGGIDSTSVYASNGSTNLTVKELYDELRRMGSTYIDKQINETAFSEYIAKVDLTDADHKEKITEYMLEAIFGSFDEETLAEMEQDDIEVNINTYIDTMFAEGIYLNTTDFDFADNIISIENMQETSAYDLLTDFYTINVAQYLYGFDELTKEIKEQDDEAAKDEDVSPYFTDATYATYYDNNYSNTEDVNALIIRFVTADEADEVFRKFGIKAYKGEWYQITLPKNEAGHVDVSIWDKESDYNTYYDEYEISTGTVTSNDQTIKSIGNDNETILKIFVEMYNYIYTYRNDISYTGYSSITGSTAPKSFLTQYYRISEIITADSLSKSETGYEDLVAELLAENSNNAAATTFTKDKLDSYSTSLTSYVNDTLRTTPEIDEDTEEELAFTQYTSTSRSYGTSSYVIFKLSETVEDDFYTTDEDEDGNTIYTFNDDVLKETIRQELFDEKLTESYIASKVSTKLSDVEINIYDSIVDLVYSQYNSNHTGSKGSSENLLALIEINDKEYKITVAQYYEYLESIYGASTSTSLLFNKYITTTDYYTDLKVDYDDYKKIVSDTLTYFANEAYASYGYPASMGKYNFMLLYFRSANVDKAIEYLMLQDAKSEYFLEVTTDESFYTTMTEYYEKAYDNYYSLTVSNILVYGDFDEDGTPDKDYFTTTDNDDLLSSPLTPTQKQALAQDLVDDLITYAKKSTASLSASFAAVVAEYNSSSRVKPSTEPEYSGSVEHKWYTYRQAGLLISTSSLGEFTNTSNLDENIQTLVEDLYNDTTNEIIYNNSFSSPYLIDSTNDSNYFMTSEGYNVLLVTAGNGKVNIDFENEKTELYEKVPVKINDTQYSIFNLASTGETATADQIEVYCREYFTTGAAASLPSSASSHLATYLQPVLAKFNSEPAQLMIMRNALSITSSDTDFDAKLTSYIEFKQRQLDGYVVNNNFTDFWSSAIFTGGDN